MSEPRIVTQTSIDFQLDIVQRLSRLEAGIEGLEKSINGLTIQLRELEQILHQHIEQHHKVESTPTSESTKLMQLSVSGRGGLGVGLGLAIPILVALSKFFHWW